MSTRVVSLFAFLTAAGLSASLPLPDVVAGPQKGKKGKADPNDGIIVNYGKPKGFEPGAPKHYWLWYDDGLWRLRTTTAGRRHKFVGRIDVIGGQLTEVTGLKGEKIGPNSDRYIWNASRNAILIDFTTDGHVDGINFRVAPTATALKFTLSIDGDAAPKLISVGKAGDHPRSAEFTLPANPPDPKN